MKRQAFVFLNKWDEAPREAYSEWLNSLLEQYPNAQIELHHSIAATSTDEFWFKICAVAIVTIDADFQQG